MGVAARGTAHREREDLHLALEQLVRRERQHVGFAVVIVVLLVVRSVRCLDVLGLGVHVLKRTPRRVPASQAERLDRRDRRAVRPSRKAHPEAHQGLEQLDRQRLVDPHAHGPHHRVERGNEVDELPHQRDGRRCLLEVDRQRRRSRGTCTADEGEDAVILDVALRAHPRQGGVWRAGVWDLQEPLGGEFGHVLSFTASFAA